MPIPIAYPDTSGYRAASQSCILKVAGNEFIGWVSVKWSRERKRASVMGANASPIGKTRGNNEFKLTISVYVAEWKAYFIDGPGAGYGDIPFSVELTITENGYDTQTRRWDGCTNDKEEGSAETSSVDPLKIESIELSPTAYFFNQLDDSAQPLGGPPQIG